MHNGCQLSLVAQSPLLAIGIITLVRQKCDIFIEPLNLQTREVRLDEWVNKTWDLKSGVNLLPISNHSSMIVSLNHDRSRSLTLAHW